jgi:hypothetical protein
MEEDGEVVTALQSKGLPIAAVGGEGDRLLPGVEYRGRLEITQANAREPVDAIKRVKEFLTFRIHRG